MPPDSFLLEMVQWAKAAPDELFEPNAADDVYSHIAPILGPWDQNALISHRKAALLEVMRVHAGFESSWNWNEGVDRTNKTSVAHLTGQETGAWQVSFDSTFLAPSLALFASEKGIGDPRDFIPAMKANHDLAMEYYVRLCRVSVKWAGPILRHEIDKWLSRPAVEEFRKLIG